MKQQILLRLEDEDKDKIKNNAGQQNISVNDYLLSLIRRDTDSVKPIKETKQSILIRLSGDEQKRLTDKASERNITPQQYIRDCINAKSFVNIMIDIADLDELLAAIYDLSKHLNGILASAERSGVSQGDINRIVALMTDCNDKINKIYKEELSDRTKLSKEAKKEIKYHIKNNKN